MATVKTGAAMVVALLCTAARADEPPRLRLETGMHLGRIMGMATDAQGRLVATIAADRSVRLWSAETGVLVQTIYLRLPEMGAVPVHVGLSSDGQKVLVEVNPLHWYAVRRDTGAIEPFSDSEHQIVGAGPAGAGLHSVAPRFQSKTPEPKGLDYHYAVDGDPNGFDVDGKGRVVRSTARRICLYDATLRHLAEVQLAAGMEPGDVRFSPDGKFVAVGYRRAPLVELRSGRDLALVYRADTVGVAGGDLSHVAFSIDGQRLFAGGSWSRGGEHPVRVWEGGGRGKYRDAAAGGGESITALVAVAGGGVAFATDEPTWGVIAPSGERVRRVAAQVVDLGGRLRVDASGDRVGFAYGPGEARAVTFSVRERMIVPGADPALLPAAMTHPRVAVLDWEGGSGFLLGGRRVNVIGGPCRALAIAPGGSWFALGCGAHIYPIGVDKVEAARFDDGQRLRPDMMRGGTFITASADVTALGVPAQVEDCAVAGLRDGTIRWYCGMDRRVDQRALLALYPHPDGKRWVAFTPAGYYDASPGGEDLIGWEVDRGAGAVPDFFPASRFRAKYHRPDIVARVVAEGDLWKAIAAANHAARVAAAPSVTTMLPPVVQVLDADAGAAVEGGRAALRVVVRAPDGAPVTRLRLLVDGRVVPEERGVMRLDDGRPPPGGGVVQRVEVTVPPNAETVAVVAENQAGASQPAQVRLKRRASSIRPDLYALVIGVGAYPAADLRLDFPGKDARDVAAALEEQRERLYRKVEVRVLTDGKATRGAILDGMDWLRRATTDKDVAVVFLAGHGIQDPGTGQYHFLPIDGDMARTASTLVPDVALRELMASTAGKVLLFLDTCHAGRLYADRNLRGGGGWTRFVNELASAENGVVVFAAATARQSSQESAAWGNGAFTKALVEGLRGRAAEGGRVTVTSLELYVSDRVKELTGGSQTPATARPSTVPDFPIAVVK